MLAATTGPVVPDGVFGPHTEQLTKEWQRARGLVVDGIVGLASWRAAGLLTLPPELPDVLKGTDLSAIQGVRSDKEWEQMADLGIRFSIMRTIVGNEKWSDTAAAENAKRAGAHGIVVWPYIFPYPLPHLNPEQQAEVMIARLIAMGFDVAAMPIAVDAEWPPPEEYKNGVLINVWAKWGCSPAQLREWIMRFITRVEQLTGRRVIVYSYRHWLRRIEAYKLPELALRHLWLADYTHMGKWLTREQCALTKSEAPWSKITILQHDGNGGLRLPSGSDADFNMLFGGEELLASLMNDKLGVPDTVPELSVKAPEPFVDLSAAKHEQLGIITEELIRSYRQNRIDEAA